MVGHNASTKTTAKKKASSLRKKGLNATVYKKDKGWGVSSTKKK